MASMDVRGDPKAAAPRTLIGDALLAGGLAVLLTVATYFASQRQPEGRAFDVGGAALVIFAAGVLAARRRHPVAILALVFGTTLLYLLLEYDPGPIWIALIVAYYTAVVQGHRVAAWITAAAGFLIFPWLDYLVRDGPAPSLLSLVALAAWLLVLLGIGEAVRIRRERAAEAVRIREEEARRRASEERLRIARELHDALGHHLSLINVQSGVALHLDEELPEQTRSSLSAIKQSSKEALTELRSVLNILRQEDERAPRSPAATVARMHDLVAQAAAGGLDVRTETGGDVRPLPFGVDIAAFRIVQEALTNVARHAGPATASVRLTYGDRDLTVQVDDDGQRPLGQTMPGSGKGIVGMRERVAALGGELEVGPRPGGGFRVRARLPLDGAR
jgi:signal transduction histidine kinase